MVDVSNPDWDPVDGNNTNATPNGWPSNMPANQVRPTAQQMMGALKRWWERSGPAITTTGATGHYLYTPTNTSYPTAYIEGDIYAAKASMTSAGNDTININSLGAIRLYKATSSGVVTLAAGDIVSGQMFVIAYDSSLNSGAGGFQVLAGISTSGGSSQLHSRVLNSSATFTIPSNATTATIFEFTVIGGGGGGGGAAASSGAGGGGGSGGVAVVSLSGFNPSDSVTVTVGAAGSVGTSSGGNGGNGGLSRITYSAVNVITANGGGGGDGYSGSFGQNGGAAGTSTAAVGASGLTLVSSITGGGQNGFATGNTSGAGGSTLYGTGGAAAVLFGSPSVGDDGSGLGAGGSGGVSTTSGRAGGAGSKGGVLIRWVL